VWALTAGGRLGVGNDPRYNKTRCFNPFPFPDPGEALKVRIRELGERLNAHREDVLGQHNYLTMTGLYNVLEKVRAGEALSEAERDVYDAGLVGVLRQIHDDLDAAVAAAYGWPADLSNAETLERLVALNRERAAEERKGQVRWLRPEFQAPKEEVAAKKAEQIEAELPVAAAKATKPSLPAALPDQVAAIRAVLAETGVPIAASPRASAPNARSTTCSAPSPSSARPNAPTAATSSPTDPGPPASAIERTDADPVDFDDRVVSGQPVAQGGDRRGQPRPFAMA
jgi:hypothetical protein